MENVEVHLVSIITYCETEALRITDQANILAQIEEIIRKDTVILTTKKLT